MNAVTVSDDYWVEPNAGSTFTGGTVLHIARNAQGGSTLTPVGRVFVTAPHIGAENFHRHVRVDCFFLNRPLAPQPDLFAHELVEVLLARDLIKEPIWVEWWRAEQLGSTAVGEVFDFS